VGEVVFGGGGIFAVFALGLGWVRKRLRRLEIKRPTLSAVLPVREPMALWTAPVALSM